MPHFTADGADIHFQTTGSGPPLLLVAGIASDSASWRPIVPRLAAHFTVILIDNRGCGRTTAPGPLSVMDMVGDCVAMLDHLAIERADVVGHSLGGAIGLRLAAAHPDRIRRLVTLCCADVGAKERMLFRDLRSLYESEAVPNQLWFRMLFQWLFSEAFFARETNVNASAELSAAYAYRQSPADFGRQVEAANKLPSLDASQVACPVLSVAGEVDLLTPPRAVAEAHRGIPDLRLEVMTGVAHSIHWEAPEAVAAAIRGFLS